jgi:propanol-preferring alcohol dehydrogenase
MMRALQLVSRGVLELRDVPVPEIGPDEVLVKVAGAGLCHSDLHVLHMPEWPVYGMTLGHETAGHVAALGADVSGFAEGEAVLVYLVWACGVCRPCVEVARLDETGCRRARVSVRMAAWRSTSRSRRATSSRSARSTP